MCEFYWLNGFVGLIWGIGFVEVLVIELVGGGGVFEVGIVEDLGWKGFGSIVEKGVEDCLNRIGNF